MWEKERRSVATVFATHGAVSGTFASRLPWISDHLHLSAGKLGIALLMSSIGAITTMPFAGRAVARYGTRLTARVLIAAFLVVDVLTPWMPSLLALMGCTLLAGAAGGTSDMAMNAQGILVEKRLGRSIMSGLHGSWSTGVLIAALFGSLAAREHLDARVHFAIAGAILSVVMVWGTQGFHTSATDVGLVEDDSESVPLFVIPRGVILLIGLVGFCGIYAEVAAQDWSSVYMHRALHGGEAEAAFTTGMFAFTMAAGRLSGDAVVGRLGATTTVRACGVLGALGGVLVVVAQGPVPAVIGFMLIGVGVSVVVPLAFAAAGHAGPSPTMGVAGVATIAYGAGMAAPGMIGGIADLTSLRVAFCAVAVLAGMVALGGGLLGRNAPTAVHGVPGPRAVEAEALATEG
ncbi:major facilitator superfamily MFS_1 [Catenulispora acidiphila DSM 44928]|uniref:Major facilitator superfamily MFS_1 n=1 Tax=Catenulispora acidiphila (strain DSM 44928 / JCM 14897 / NBRC 102108 / NRRL B-24433 / ID139908) TaxID=479433 RepID=C7Q854_CATAD|nr:MFS transporter [Catenulispora acidiphila]ACU74221.1 major facilitator superfamily MFS_1 [Catenulispora acidiphila DSM 44928]